MPKPMRSRITQSIGLGIRAWCIIRPYTCQRLLFRQVSDVGVEKCSYTAYMTICIGHVLCGDGTFLQASQCDIQALMDKPVCQESLILSGFKLSNWYLCNHQPGMSPNFRSKDLFDIPARHVYRMTLLVTLADREVCLVRAQDDQSQGLTRLNLVLSDMTLELHRASSGND